MKKSNLLVSAAALISLFAAPARAQSVMEKAKIVPVSIVNTAFRISALVEQSRVDELTRLFHAEFIALDSTGVTVANES